MAQNELTYAIRADVADALRRMEELESRIRKVSDAANDNAKAVGEMSEKVEETADATDKAADKSATLTDRVGGLKASYVAAAAAIAGAAIAVKKLAEEMDRQDGIISALSISIDEAARRTGGLVSRIDLMAAANRASQAGLDLTAKQFATLSAAALKYAEATGQDGKQAIETLAQAIVNGNERALKPLGIELESTGSLAEKQAEALDKLTKKYGELSVAGDTLGDTFEVAKNGWADLLTAFLEGEKGVGGLSSAFEGLNKNVSAGVGIMAEWARSFGANVAAGYAVLQGGGTGPRGQRGAAQLWIGQGTVEPIGAAKAPAAGAGARRRDSSPSAGGGQVDGLFPAGGDGFALPPEPTETQKRFGAMLENLEAEASLHRAVAEAERERAETLAKMRDEADATAAVFAGPLASSYASSVEAFASGEQTIGKAAKAMVVGTMKALGQRAIADGTFDIMSGTTRLLYSYGTDQSGTALIGQGGAKVALGTALVAGGAAIGGGSSRGKGGGSAAPASPTRDGGGSGQGSAPATYVINYNSPVPEEEIGRMNQKADRAARRRFERSA